MRKAKGTALILAGFLLMAAALGLTVYNMRTELQAGESAAQALKQLAAAKRPGTSGFAAGDNGHAAPQEAVPAAETSPEMAEQPDYVRFPDMEMPTVEVDGNTYIGTLRIPDLGLELPVMSDWSYPQLKIAPCRYMGSAYSDRLILIAHNYASHFGYLKKLQPGAEVTFTDMANNVFCYAVAETEILKPQQVEELEDTDYSLTLLTCTIGGETRVTVRCEKIGEIPAE